MLWSTTSFEGMVWAWVHDFQKLCGLEVYVSIRVQSVWLLNLHALLIGVKVHAIAHERLIKDEKWSPVV